MNETSLHSAASKALETYLRDLESGQTPDREAFLARYPALVEVLAPALDGIDFVHGVARTLKGAAGDAEVEMGEVLGDYRLLREIGRGGMAIVYEAEQVSLGRRVALKVLPFAAVLDPKQRQRFKNEALAAAQLRHPHIVPVYAVGGERGVHYYAMQYIEGGSLAAGVREMKTRATSTSPFSAHRSNREPAYIRMTATLGIQAAEALDHAHQLGVVHRDVKPGNLLVDPAGKLWVTDFGLARSRKDGGLTMSGELLGTVRYMSPEQALAKRIPVDHRTDVYSLGATLYELLTLEVAFPGDDLHEVIEAIAFKEAVRPRRLNSALPVDLETVVLKAMAKDADARYATAQEMADDLRRFLDDKPILARRPSLAKRAGKWVRRHRAGVATAATILFVGVVALAAGAMREERNTREALNKASSALAKAETNLDLAYRAVNEFLTQVGTNRFEDQPTFTPELAALFDHALGFYDLYLAERSDPYGYIDKSYILAARGRHDEALAAANQAVKISENLVLAHFARGTALRLLHKHEAALEALNRAVDLDPKRAESYLQRGVVYKDLGQVDEAVKDWDRALGLDPNLPKALNNRGMCREMLGRHQEAHEDFDRATKSAPNFAVAWLNKSIALAGLAEFEEALVAVNRAIALLPDSADAHMNRGAVLTALGRHDEAFEAVCKALEKDPKLGRAHYNKSVYLSDRGKREEAYKELELAIEYEPSYPPAHGNKGLLLFQRGEFREALAQFDRAIFLDRNFVPAHCGRGQAFAALNQLDDALAAYEKAIDIDAKCIPALVNRVGILNSLGRHEEALKRIDDVMRVNSKVPMVHMFKCISLYSVKRYEQALIAIDEAIRLDGKDGEHYQKRGACLEALKDAKGALAAYDEAIDRGYLAPDLLNQVAWIRAVSPDAELRNVPRAVQLAEEGVRISQERDPRLLNTLGVAYCRAEQWQKALDTLEKSMNLADGGTPFDWFFVAIAQWKLGHQDKARNWYDEAVAGMERGQEDEELKRFHAEASEILGVSESRSSRLSR